MYWYQGKLIESDTLEIDINQPALLYGANVFTTLRVYNNSLDHPLTHWQEHGDRLFHTLQAMKWPNPDWERIRQGALTLIPNYPVLRITIFPDGEELIIGRNLPTDLEKRQQQGITTWLADQPLYTRTLANYKTGNYLGAYLAIQQAKREEALEAILVDAEGNWLETATGNLWGWCEGCWYTPVIEENILAGIARSHILQQIKAQENTWDGNFVRKLEAIAYSNSVIEIIPIHTIITKEEQIKPNPHHQALQKLKNCFTL